MIITSVMFSAVTVALLVALSAGLHKNYQRVFHVTWMEDGSWLRIDTINFCCRFRKKRHNVFPHFC